MAVFKVYMKITKKNIWLVCLYVVIFFILTLLFQGVAGRNAEQEYAAESISIGVVDEDGGPAAAALTDTLRQTNQVTVLENNREMIQENLYYGNIKYVVRIPEHFMENCILGEEALPVTTMPGTYTGSYVDQQISSFINSARVRAAAGFTEEEIADALEKQEKPQVELADLRGNAGEMPAFSFYYRYLAYLVLCVMCYVLGYILIAFGRGQISRRMYASAVPLRRQRAEGLLASGVLALALWIFCTAAAFLLYGREIYESGSLGYLLLNSGAVVLVSVTIAYLIGMFVKNPEALSGIVNIVYLSMSFICGVFVDLDYLSSGVRKAAQFLPVYWYERVNNLVAEYGASADLVKEEILQGIGIQLVFAAAFLCITMAASRERT